MEKYPHQEIEKKWRAQWEADGTYRSTEGGDKPKAYILDMFPYPSGEGLHVGHPKGYIATDVLSRMRRMQGHNVLHPMGWDAFGLPAENFAIKNKIHPRTAVDKNVARYKEQLQYIGLDYDWSREINTTDPEYYKWTQWIFLQLYKQGLAYESHEPINWCPSCMTGLASEDLEDGKCERCGSEVEKKPMRQWVLRITDYADRLLYDLDELDQWPENIKEMQRNWIGRSEGAEIEFRLKFTLHPEHGESKDQDGKSPHVRVFTTRPDTLFGATYVVLAPEHPWVRAIWDTPHDDTVENKAEVAAYVAEASRRSEIERTAEGKEKTGVELMGIKAINPANNEEIPVFVADYVLGHYGTGAIMAVPAHDERDYAFAKQFDLPIRQVIESSGAELPYIGGGSLIASGAFDGSSSEDAKAKITEAVGGEMKTTYRLQDWVFSRQRYWGEPIPLIHCEKCGVVPVPEGDLPVKLPEVESYEPTGTGESPLASIDEWVNTTCPECGGAGKRETNTMPQWAGSCWYYMRFTDPNNDQTFADAQKEKYWMPVDVYVGGAEHATRHLIYARFWHKVLYDQGLVSTNEPFGELHSVGLIMAEDGRKMSKRYGNVINPDEIVMAQGADTLRVYEMFMGPFDNAIAWNTRGLVGARRFLDRIWTFQEKVGDAPNEALEPVLHQTIKKVTEDIPAFKFNTAVSQLMIYVNALEEAGSCGREQWTTFLKLLAPFAPHMTEELWRRAGNETSIHLESWPAVDESKLVADEVTIAVQVNGKTRAQVVVEAEADEVVVRAAAEEAATKWLAEGEVKKVIFVPGRLINFVVS